MIPLYIEQFNLIVDFHDISLLNLDISILKSIFDVLVSLFPNCVNQIFFYNLSKSASIGMKMADLMLAPQLLDKVRQVERGREEQIFFYIPRDNLFQSLKGELEDPINYWPPKDTYSHLSQSEKIGEADFENLGFREFYILDEYDSQIFGKSLLMLLHKPWTGKGNESNLKSNRNSDNRAFGAIAGQFRPSQPTQNMGSEILDPGIDLGDDNVKKGDIKGKGVPEDQNIHQINPSKKQSKIEQFDPTMSEIDMEADIIKMQNQFESKQKGHNQLSKNTKSAILNRLEQSDNAGRREKLRQSPIQSKKMSQSMRNHTVQNHQSQRDSIFGPLDRKTKTQIYAEKNSIRNKYFPRKKPKPRPNTPSPEAKPGIIDQLFNLVCCSDDKVEQLGQEDTFWEKFKVKAVDFKQKYIPSKDKSNSKSHKTCSRKDGNEKETRKENPSKIEKSLGKLESEKSKNGV